MPEGLPYQYEKDRRPGSQPWGRPVRPGEDQPLSADEVASLRKRANHLGTIAAKRGREVAGGTEAPRSGKEVWDALTPKERKRITHLPLEDQ